MSVFEDSRGIPDDPSSSFQRLSLAIPVDAKNYTLIPVFLSQILNLATPDAILAAKIDVSSDTVETLDLLPNISFPPDLWVKDDLCIRDVKIKTAMLLEINTMIDRELSKKSVSNINFDDHILNYYDKLLNAYKGYELPVRSSVSSPVYTPPELSLREEEDEDANSTSEDYDTKSIARTSSDQSSTSSQKKSFTSNKHNSVQSSASNNTNHKRISALSRELIAQRKRFSAMMGQDVPSGGTTPGSINHNQNHNQNHNNEPEDDKKVLNGLLAKSRIYNKIKKHRESSSSINSSSSVPSTYSNRNSISTTNTTSTNISRRRGSSTFASPDINESRYIASQQTPQSPPFSLLTQEQRSENRKSKYDYYIQLIRLTETSQNIINHAINTGSDPHVNVVKFVEYLKKKVIKFIIIDISQMILDYAQLKAYNSYNLR